MLLDYLSTQGFGVRAAVDYDELDRQLTDQPADLIVLDPDRGAEDGIEVAARIRAQSRVGLVLLSACGELETRIRGLQQGADDYVVKPVDLRELLARLRSVLRRIEAEMRHESEAATVARSKVPFGRYELDRDCRRLMMKDGREASLTPMEFDILETFARHPGQVLTREQICELAHNRHLRPSDRSIDIRITRLRRKIELDPAHPTMLRTVRNVGYVFSPAQPSPDHYAGEELPERRRWTEGRHSAARDSAGHEQGQQLGRSEDSDTER